MALGVALAFDLLARDTASPAFLRVAGAADKAAAATARSTAALAKSGGATTRFAAGMSAAGAKMTKGFTAPLIGLAAVSVDQAMKFQKAMTLIQTAGGETAAKTAVISKGILKVATDTGTSLKDLNDGIYVVAKAGGSKWSATDQLKLLKAAAQGAKAENVDLGTSVNALTSVMMSYHIPASKAVEVQNELIVGAGRAKTTMQNYAAALSTVVPVASAAHISFAQVAGAIATMTQHGTSADEATQELSHTIRNLLAPNQVAQKSMQQLGLSVTDVTSNLGKRGLGGTIDLITNAIGKQMGPAGMVVVSTFKKSQAATADLKTMMDTMPKSLADLSHGLLSGKTSIKDYQAAAKGLGGDAGAMGLQFLSLYKGSKGFNDLLKSGQPAARTFAGTLKQTLGTATSMNTALQLGGENAAYFKTTTDAVAAAARHSGADVLGWAKTQDTLAVKMDKAKASLQVLAVEIGTALIPVVTKIANAVGKAAHWFSGLSSTSKQVVGWSLVAVAAIGPVIAILTRLYMVGRTVGVAALGLARFAKGLALMNVAVATTETRAYGAGASMRMFLRTLGGGPVLALTAFAVAVGLGGKALSNYLEKGDAGVYVMNHLGAATKSFTAALKASNGAMDENVRTAVAKQLQDSGLAAKAHKANISISQLTDAVTGGKPAMDALIATWKASGKPSQQTLAAFEMLFASYQGGTSTVDKLKTKQAELNTVNLKVATGTSSLRKGLQNTYAEQVPAAARATGTLSSKVAAYHDNAITAISVTTGLGNQLKWAALKGQALSDALSNIDGGAIGTAEAFIAFKQQAHGLAASLDKNNKSIVGNSAAALQNRGAILGVVDAAKQHAAALVAQHKGAKVVAAALSGDIQSLISQASAAHMSTKEIDNLLSSMGLMPKQIATALHVNGAQQAAQAILDVQHAIDQLHDKSITITQYERQVGITGPHGSADTNSGKGRNTTAVGSRAAYGRPDGTIPPNTTFTVGEGADHTWEGGVSDAQGRVTIFSNKQSKSMGFQTPVHYAKGSSKPDQGTLSSAASSAIGNIGSIYSPKFQVADTGILTINAQIAKAWDVLRAQISKGLSSAAAAAFRKEIQGYTALAAKQLSALRHKITHGDTSALAGAAVNGTGADVKTAAEQMIADAKAAGDNAKAISALRAGETALLAVQKQRAGVMRQLDKDQTKLADMKSYRSGITSTLAGGFDPTKYGSVTDLVSGLGGATGTNKAYTSELNGLRGRAKGNKTLTAFINQLAASGQTSTLQMLAGASKSDLSKVSASLGGYNASLGAAGNAATLTKYGKSVSSEQSTVAADREHIRKLGDDMKHIVGVLARFATHPKVEVHLNGKQISAEVIHSPEMQHLIDEISDAVAYGRKH